MDKYRVMIQGEDGMLWCEANNLTYEQAQDNGDEYCDRYENATWWIEKEESVMPFFNDYEEDEEEY